MTIKTLGCIFFLGFFGPLLSMEPETGDFEKANSLLMDYNKLSAYLYEQCGTLSPDLINIKFPGLNNWIKQKGFDSGNVVCAYFFVRNCLENDSAENIVWKENEFAQRLTMILLILQKVAYDIVLHYTKFKDPSVFHAYAVFKEKLYNLLKWYAQRIQHPAYKVQNLGITERHENFAFATICKASVEHWESKKWYNLPTHNNWTKFFDWSHGWTPGIYGIYFGPEPSQEIDINHQETAVQRYAAASIVLETFALIGAGINNKTNSFKITYDSQAGKPNSWAAFFQSFNFPLTKKQLDDALKNDLLLNSL